MDTAERLWIEQLKSGDEQAYRYLYDRHYSLLCRFANTFVQDPYLAETLVSDAIFHLWEIREKLEITVSLRSYLMRAVRNRCYNYLQQGKEKQEISLSEIETEAFAGYVRTEEHPLGILLERELENEIVRSIEQLGEECKRTFKKSRFEHKKNEEIAAELGISVHTVKYHIRQAISRLHQDLGKYLLSLFLFLIRFS